MIFTIIPATLKILVIFVVILLAIRMRLPLGATFLLGAVLLGIFFGVSQSEIFMTALSSLFDAKTLALAGVVCLILVLSHSLEAAGQMERLLKSFRGLVRHPGLNLIVFPAIIGLLPMPGGAVFSAPMVKTLGKRHGLNGAQLSFINFWFRHIWEYWWPLYPGVLLAVALAGFDLWSFVVFLMPLTPVSLAAGSWPLRKMVGEDQAPKNEGHAPAGPFIIELSPILIVIVLGLGSGMVFSRFPALVETPIAKELGLIMALSVSILWVWKINNLTAKNVRLILFRPDLLRMFLMVAAILIFKGVLEESGAVAGISRELIGWKIPLTPITVILPLAVGAVTGLTIAFVGTTFPILISLVHTYGLGDLLLPYVILAMISGFVGVLLSPLHLCLILSNKYFETGLPAVYSYLLRLCAVLLSAGIVYFFTLKMILG